MGTIYKLVRTPVYGRGSLTFSKIHGKSASATSILVVYIVVHEHFWLQCTNYVFLIKQTEEIFSGLFWVFQCIAKVILTATIDRNSVVELTFSYKKV